MGEVIRGGVGSQHATFVRATNGGVNGVVGSSPTEDETTALIVKVTAQNAVAVEADIVVDGMTWELLN